MSRKRFIRTLKTLYPTFESFIPELWKRYIRTLKRYIRTLEMFEQMNKQDARCPAGDIPSKLFKQ